MNGQADVPAAALEQASRKVRNHGGRSKRRPVPKRYTYTDDYRSDAPFLAGQKLVLEEPFSETDEEVEPVTEFHRLSLVRKARQHHLSLPLPKQRIRTLSGTIPPTGYSPVWGGPTMCLKCLEFFNIPNQTQQYVEHLIDLHKIVIAEIDLIVDLKRYIEYWRHRFGQVDIGAHFPKIVPKETDPLHGRVDSYYLMSCRIAEDRQIRERLATSRLEEVIACQQRERTDKSFCRQCLFCRYIVRGNRARYIHHLYLIHRLNLGSPDNLVFVSEYIDILAEKMTRNECLYCESAFPNHRAMMQHIRTMGHWEVNPRNSAYDKFYLINYLELGKKWQEVMAEDFEDIMQTFTDSDDDSESDTWMDWVEDDDDGAEESGKLVCLLCDKISPTLHDLLQHQLDEHKFDLSKMFDKESLDFYGRVKLINYIRRMMYKVQCFLCEKSDFNFREALKKHLKECDKWPSKELWDKEEYLMPTYENDYLLTRLDEIGNAENPVDRVFASETNSSLAEPDTVTSEPPPSIQGSVLEDKELVCELR